jgi:hypothetical protein
LRPALQVRGIIIVLLGEEDVNDSNNEIGGLAGISIGQPLDTVKVRLQAMVITIT